MANWFPIFSSSVPVGTTWSQLKIGAGGWVSGLDIAADGTKVIRTDTFGAYNWNTSTLQWDLITTSTSMPAGHFGHDPNNNLDYLSDGVYEIMIAPSNTSRFYMCWYGKMYISNNKGATWSYLSGFSTVSGCIGNDHSNRNCLAGPKMAIDPINADHVLVGTANNGLFRSTDAGVNWTHITDVPNASSSVVLVLFDPSSTQSGGKTQGIYCGSAGNGVYKSTNAGVNFSTTSYPITTLEYMAINTAGVLYVCPNDGTSNLKIYNGSWSSKSVGTASNQLTGVAIDPSSNAKISCVNFAGRISYSSDTAATFTGFSDTFNSVTRTITAGDPPWLGTCKEEFLSSGGIKYDPSQSSTLYFSEGIGVWRCVPSGSMGSGFAWTSQSKGIEQLVANGAISPPGFEPLVTAWDRPVFRVADPLVYPSNQGPNNNVAIVQGCSIDWASSSPATIVLNASVVGTNNAFSSDAGQSWATLSPPASANIGGMVACSTPTNWVWIGSSGDLGIWYTTNGSATPTWNAASITGPTVEGFASNGNIDRQILCADRVNANTFYLYYNGTQNSDGAGTNANGAIAGIYKSTNSGANWTKVFAGRLGNMVDANQHYTLGAFAAKLRSVPNISSTSSAGHLYWTAGDRGGSTAGAFARSTDGGTTWTNVANVLEALDVGFGAPAPGGDYPAVYIAGWVGGTTEAFYGIYRSTSTAAQWASNTQTWTKLTDYPYGNPDFVKCISGDSNTYGKVYVGFIGSGWAYGR